MKQISIGLILGIATTALSPVLSFSVKPASRALQSVRCYSGQRRYSRPSSVLLQAKPKRGSVVDSYQTVSVNCASCGERLFRYKKKNGTKSSLVKCFIERISEDSAGVLQAQEDSGVSREEFNWACPTCEKQFARPAQIKGLPALKIVGGKVRMTKK
jgi:endogenous inhibitor of DNA gyrase (YacG/DUF329 family)